MRAAVLACPRPLDERPLQVVERAVPSPKRGEILIRVSSCGICRTDLHVVEGELPQRRDHLIPGHQIVGEVVKCGDGCVRVSVGERVGVPWLHWTCGACRHCARGQENLCDRPEFTGWTVDGGFADYVVAVEDFVYALPPELTDVQAAPLLCAGIIGYRALRLTGIRNWSGARLGIYGFGAAGHVAIQIARSRGAEVYVSTRDREKHRTLAEELGAVWTGGTTDRPPVLLDASIVFAPAGELVPVSLEHVDKGGTVVLGGIHMTDIPGFPYSRIYQERSIRSVANNTRTDGREFLEEAARIGVTTRVETFSLADVNEALLQLRNDGIRGAGVLTLSH